MDHEEKYVVFKSEDFDDWCRGVADSDLDDLIIEDAVVIRLQDMFAAPALYSYANTIRTVTELLEKSSPLVPSSAAILDRLHGIADYFIGRALVADMMPTKKLPD